MNGNPEYANIHISDEFSDSILVEYRQSYEEGRDIEPFEELFQAVHKMPYSEHKEIICRALYDMSAKLPQRNDYPFTEPDDYSSILKLRDGKAKAALEIPSDYRSKLHGAWLGRIIGCLLGKPFEGMMSEVIELLLKASSNYPLHRYAVSTDVTDELIAQFNGFTVPTTWADLIPCAPIDDDTNYTVLSQVLIQDFGKNFTSEDVCKIWLGYQPSVAYYTAEKITYRNIINGMVPPETALHYNPFREWVGAQIRSDYYGYLNPGNPEAAAEMAWRDARISHTKNAIYGTMFIAAMGARAAVSTDIPDIIRSGLAQIPATSRLYYYITKILSMYESGSSVYDCYAFIHREFDEHDPGGHGWCHSLSNACIVCTALLYSEGDAAKAICLAVQTGFDTDCNGATVGSIMGMRGGENAFSSQWTDPLRGKLRTSIVGVGDVEIEELVDRTLKQL